MNLYLSRLRLNACHNRTRKELEYPYELHRTICRGWGNDHQAARILFRCEQDNPFVVSVIVQSMTKPDWSQLEASKDYLHQVDGPKLMMLEGLRQGQLLHFCLRCRPSKRIGGRDKVDLGKRKGLVTKDEILAWLHRKAETGGFSVREAIFDRIYWYDSKGGVKDKPLGGIVFNGILVVTDCSTFRQTVCSGVGPQKSFGFGLLSIAPVK